MAVVRQDPQGPNLDTGRLLATLQGHTDSVYGGALSPDGRHAVSASYDRTVRVWVLERYECILVHRGDAPYISVATTASLLVAGDDHGTVWFLDWPRR